MNLCGIFGHKLIVFSKKHPHTHIYRCRRCGKYFFVNMIGDYLTDALIEVKQEDFKKFHIS